ncbi:brevican core protein-like isoform X2 [Copidosoma floridanum]|uniref:brevican core protein-like isoform X2 n=1 Tax=Copidosoma floridanum TaxID=29053 RepID=UPI0006C9AF53|nr:brevican core protein-like isoform X2 [Copidosoma floridanum]
MVFKYSGAVTDICLLVVIFVITPTQTFSMSVGHSSEANGLQNVLTELEKISSSLKSIGSINDKLISNIRDNATRYGFKSRNPEDFAKRGYTCINGTGWYKLYLNNVTWNEARKSCRGDEAHLAIINSENEAEEDEWVTVFGDPLIETGYNRWSVGPPKILLANCAVLFEDGKLLGIPCNAVRSYFCEIPGIPTCWHIN